MSAVTRFTLAYAAAFAAFAAGAGERRAVAYLFVLGCSGGLAWWAHRVAHFSRPVCWALSLAGLLHLAGGLFPSPQRGAVTFYETWLVDGVLKYDQLVHFSVSAVVTFAAWELVGTWVDEQRCRPGARAFMAASLALAGGALNEGIEFLSALRFADAYVGGLDNTGWDLVFNAFGTACAAVWLAATTPVRRGQVVSLRRSVTASQAKASMAKPSRPALPPVAASVPVDCEPACDAVDGAGPPLVPVVVVATAPK